MKLAEIAAVLLPFLIALLAANFKDVTGEGLMDKISSEAPPTQLNEPQIVTASNNNNNNNELAEIIEDDEGLVDGADDDDDPFGKQHVANLLRKVNADDYQHPRPLPEIDWFSNDDDEDLSPPPANTTTPLQPPENPLLPKQESL